MRLLSCIYLSVSECAYRISRIVLLVLQLRRIQGMRECSRMNAGDALM